MNTTRRQVIKTTGVLGTLVSLGIITQAQAVAADARQDSRPRVLLMRSPLWAVPPRPAPISLSIRQTSLKTVRWCLWALRAKFPIQPTCGSSLKRTPTHWPRPLAFQKAQTLK